MISMLHIWMHGNDEITHWTTLEFSGLIVTSVCRHITQPQLAHEMVYRTFKGNEATRWGNNHEAGACRMYESLRDVNVRHPGLIVHPEMRECTHLMCTFTLVGNG